MRNRLIALITASAVTLGVAPVANAVPTASVRESAHGQWMCTVTPTTADTTAAAQLHTAYEETVQKAALAVQGQFTEFADVFARVGSVDIFSDASLAGAITALHGAGYNNNDILLIMVGGRHPELVVSDQALLYIPEASLSRAIALRDQANAAAAAGHTKAPLLSAGTSFSTKFQGDLRTAEASVNLAAATAAFDKQTGYAAMAGVWDSCVTQLRAKGATEGVQPLPDIEYPVPAPPQGGSSSSSAIDPTTGAVVGIFALLAIAGVGYAVANGASWGNLGGLPLPVLKAQPGF